MSFIESCMQPEGKSLSLLFLLTRLLLYFSQMKITERDSWKFITCTLCHIGHSAKEPQTVLLPIARPSLKLCMPSPMMTIQAMLAIPASFISWSEWQFPPWEWPWLCPCLLCCLALRPLSLVGDWSSCWGFVLDGASGVLLLGESGVWSSVSCVSLWLLSQEMVVLSGSEGERKCYIDCHVHSGKRQHEQTRLTFSEWLQVQPLCIRATI